LVYLAILPLLAGVLVLGRAQRGAQSWFQLGPFQFQPSELAKVGLIVAIAGYCHQHRGDLDAWRLATVVGLAGGVMALVYGQHDLGTTLVIMVCASAVLVVAGIKPVHIGVLLLLGASLVGAAVVTGKVEATQLDRLTNFAQQETKNQKAVKGEQYNLKQSKIAIASGGFTGAGLFDGLQTKSGAVPEQHTDFIFTAVGEELGFAGGATLIALYGLLDVRRAGVREHRHDDGHHADHRHPAAVHVVRRLGGDRVVHRRRPCVERPHAPLQLKRLCSCR
jgi:rod shape determining protein RodA